MAITPNKMKEIWLINPEKDGLPPTPKGYVTVDVRFHIGAWLEEQPIHEWKYDVTAAYNGSMDRFIISERLFTLMALRWS